MNSPFQDIPKYARAVEVESPSESAATTLVNLAKQRAELFHSGEVCYATIGVGEHLETHALRSRGFRGWLSKCFFEERARAASGEALSTAIQTLEGFARFESAERLAFVRVAGHEGRVFLDLCDQSWCSVEIGPRGWDTVDSRNCPVRFRRAHGMLALPMPERGGTIDELRPFLNVGSNDDFLLVVAWLVGAFHPHGPYPALNLQGEHGSAKTTSSKVLRGLIDPNMAPLRSEPREPRDLMIAASNGLICAFDNLSHLPDWLSDALCRLSTGGGFGTRQLYTDDEEKIFEAKRPVLLNGIEELATRGDLLDRSINVCPPRIREEKCLSEAKFFELYEEARPRILGALLDAVSVAVSNSGKITLERLPRMADFAMWVVGAEDALGWAPGAFLRAYMANRKDANELPLETPIVDALRQVPLPMTGTATQLLATLETLADERAKRMKSWPTSGRSLGNILRRLAPNLRQVGINVEFTRQGHNRTRLICLTSIEDIGKGSSAASAGPNSADDSGLDADDASEAASIPPYFESSNLGRADSADGEKPPAPDEGMAEEEL